MKPKKPRPEPVPPVYLAGYDPNAPIPEPVRARPKPPEPKPERVVCEYMILGIRRCTRAATDGPRCTKHTAPAYGGFA